MWPKFQTLARTLACLEVFLVSSATRMVALDPTSRISQYGHSVWRLQDGYFGAAPRRVAQTTDGYIWIGTGNGLFKFDGVRFIRWTAQPGEDLPSPSIRSLLGARDGSLWIGTDAGLAHLVNGRLSLFEDGWRIYELAEDKNQQVWLTRTRSQDHRDPICQILDNAVHCYGSKDGLAVFASDDVGPMAPDAAGDLWIGSDRSVVRWRPGEAKVYRPQALQSNPGYAGVVGIEPAPDGSVWVGIAVPGRGGGLQHLVNDTLIPFVSPNLNGETLSVSEVHSDHQGNLWVATLDHGLYKINGTDVDHYGSGDGLSADFAGELFEDREGNIWVMTTEGLDMFRDLRVRCISTREGLSQDSVESVAAGTDGRVYIGTSSVQFLDPTTMIWETIGALKGEQVTSLFVDDSGRLWAGVDNKLFVGEQRKFREITNHDGRSLGMIVGIAEDSDHDIWVETKEPPDTLIRMHDLKVQQIFSAPAAPLARRIVADHERGIWLGLVTGDLALFRDGQAQTFTFGEHPNSRVLAITAASDGSILGGTAFGVVAWKNGKQQILSMQNGLPCNYVSGLISDDAGNLWLYAQCGIIEIPREQMQLWWEHPERKLNLKVLDAFDGFRTGSPHFNTSAKTPDGRLWFANGRVLQVVDPAHLSQHADQTPVHISTVVADRKEYSPDSEIKLPALTRDLEIDYAALDYRAPQKVLFRYMLEGRDAGFQEAGTRRQTFYNDLRPGHYRFRVVASNSDGVWNQAGASLEFAVLPALYQTNWFRGLCFFGFMALLWGIYQLRIQQLRRQFDISLDARLNERIRIARELHDTLLQSFQGLLLRFQAASNLLPTRPYDAKLRLDTAIDQASQAIAEGRDAVQGLRSSTSVTNDLAVTLRILGEDLLAGTGAPEFPVIDIAVEGEPRPLRPIVRDEVYRISAEGLRNAFRHARAKRIEIEIRYEKNEFRVRIRDDGKGMDAWSSGTGAGHFGLSGMRERAKVVGANLEVWSNLDSGTELQLTMPAFAAYETSEAHKRHRFLRRAESRPS